MTENEKKFYKTIGYRLKKIRKEKKLSRRQFSEILNCHQQTIVSIEEGINRIHLHKLFVFCKALNITVNEVLNKG